MAVAVFNTIYELFDRFGLVPLSFLSLISSNAMIVALETM